MSKKLPKEVSIADKKYEINKKIQGLAWQNFVFRSFNLCNNEEIVSEMKKLFEKYQFLCELENEKNTVGS